MINTTKPTLHLVTSAKWFKLIQKGIKTVDYREITEYYAKLFSSGQIRLNGTAYEDYKVNICFHSRGSKYHATMLLECEGLSIGVGKPEWGAEPNVPYYRLCLGKILAIGNYEM